MSALENSIPIFAGEFVHALDKKKRVTIPARWRSGKFDKAADKADNGDKATKGDEYYLVRSSTGKFLKAMPPKEFQKVRDEVNGRAELSAQQKANMLKMFAAQAQHVVLDSQGRIVIPEPMGSEVGLVEDSDAVLVGAMDTFELWNKAAWEQHKLEQRDSYQAIIATYLGI